MDWFLYDNGLRHERVNIRSEIWQPLNLLNQGMLDHTCYCSGDVNSFSFFLFLRYHFQLGKMDSLEHFETSS